MSNSAIPPVTVPPTPPGGIDTQVQFNDAGAFGGDAGLTYNKSTDSLSAGTILGNGTIPSGGTSGQVLAKTTSTNYDVNWSAPASGGGGDLSFVYTQVSPSSNWSVPHNLGKFPSIEVVDSGGSIIVPNVVYVDANNLTVSFASSTSGKVYCN